MNLLAASLICLGFWLPATLLAAEQKKVEKNIIIEADVHVDGQSIADIVSRVEAEIGDESQANVFVLVDDQGNVNIKKGDMSFEEMGDKLHKRIKLHITGDEPMEHHGPGRHMMAMMGHGTTMSEGTASCILKNLNKVNSDAGAHLLRQACQALNPE